MEHGSVALPGTATVQERKIRYLSGILCYPISHISYYIFVL
jgi:hypothetical protein